MIMTDNIKHLQWIHCTILSTILSTLWVLLHLIFIKTLRYRYYYYLHFIDNKTEERLSGLPHVTQLANGRVRAGFLTLKLYVLQPQ